MLDDSQKESIDLLLEALRRQRSMLAPDKFNQLRERDYDDVMEAFGRLKNCCFSFYSYDAHTVRDPFGPQGGEVVDKVSREPTLVADILLPWTAVDMVHSEQTLKQVLLFSDFALMTVPGDLDASFISCLGERRATGLDTEKLLTCLALNAQYESLLKNRHHRANPFPLLEFAGIYPCPPRSAPPVYVPLYARHLPQDA